MNTDQKIIKNKVGLLNLAEMLGSVQVAIGINWQGRRSRQYLWNRVAQTHVIIADDCHCNSSDLI